MPDYLLEPGILDPERPEAPRQLSMVGTAWSHR